MKKEEEGYATYRTILPVVIKHILNILTRLLPIHTYVNNKLQHAQEEKISRIGGGKDVEEEGN